MERHDRWPGYASWRIPGSGSHRSPGRRDRDRILYTSAFRRLSGVTQVAAASEGAIFHNRLTHSLEVAQVARGIAETIIARHSNSTSFRHLVDSLGGLDPDVVEAAGLAHDLGHPPFGHLGEEELNKGFRKATKNKLVDGFEGNAQTFRIVVKLAQRREHMDGLDLCAATLNAILKYPWTWEKAASSPSPEKWGCYESEVKVFEWARTMPGVQPFTKTLEADVMDWADDITYALHDLEDFYRAGLIPLDVLSRQDSYGYEERERFISGVLDRRGDRWPYPKDETEHAVDEILGKMTKVLANRPYDGTPELRRCLRATISELIHECIEKGSDVDIEKGTYSIQPNIQRMVRILKELTWHYVINGPEVATQRRGQRKIVSDLFREFFKAIHRRKWSVLPIGYQRIVENAYADLPRSADDRPIAARLTCDFISALTEQQAMSLHRRVTGAEMGRLIGPVV